MKFALTEFNLYLRFEYAFLMKLKCHIIIVFLLLTSLQVKSQVVFSETFESGALPAGWTTIFESGAVSWTYANGGNSGHPAAAHGGTKNALFFFGSYSGQTTKLVTSPLDLSAVNLPVLKFWHTQDAWVADQDQLRIYYKTSAGGAWNLLATYTSEIINWTQEAISLPNKSATYYIAFEARTGYGYGVCIDDVTVEQTPSVPKSLTSISINQASIEYILKGSNNNPILRLDVDVAGNSGSLLLNSIEINTLNTNNSFVNTNGVKIFATNTANFSPASQVGTAQSISSNKAVFSTLNYDLPAGISYLWITYDISSGALPDMLFDAFIDVNKININSLTYPATIQSPAGNRILLETIFQDDFETDNGWILTGEFERNIPLGLGGSYQNPDPANAYSGTKVLGTDLSGLGIYPGDYEPALSNKVYSATSPIINCKFYSDVKLRFYRWLNIENWDKAYIDISNDSGVTWHQVWSSTLTMNAISWSFQEIDISAYADKKAGVKIRYSLGTTDGTNQCSGWNLDDVILIGDFYNPEVAVTSILLPVNGCSHTAADSVKITIKNFGALPTNDTLRVCYSFDGGINVVYDTIFTPIANGESLVFTFRQTADLSVPATFDFFAATLVPNDKYTENDTLHKSITASPQFNIPYFTDFESGQSGWYTGGINSSWQYGTPTSTIINHAASGIKAWKTNIANNYNSDEISYLQSPCYDFTGISDPVIEFKLWWISEPDFDGASLLYSVDDAVTWLPVGAYGDLNNWFNFDTITTILSGFGHPTGWSYISNNWVKVKHLLPPVIANNPDVKFRIVFASNNLSTEEGFAFDDLAIYDNQPDIGVSSLVSPISACSLSSENISVTILNYGEVIYNIGDTIKAGLLVNGTQIVIDNIILTAPFYPGTSITHTFSIPVNMNITGDYIIDAYTLLPGDLNATNNNFSTTITNYGYPAVTLLNLLPSYCNDASNVTLSGNPPGGTFSGSGVTGSTFSPSALSPASYKIVYSYTDINTCSGTDTVTTIIYPAPSVSFTGLDTSYCINSGNATLTGNPPGGTFSGNGITGNTFHPDIANAGIHTIIYSYTNINNCSNSASKNIQVFNIPALNFSGLDTAYCTNTSSVTLTGNPPGGSFSGNGIAGNLFTPSNAGSGNHTITYIFTDNHLCTNSVSKNVIINNSPIVNFTGLDTLYCINASTETLFGSPSGGTFYGSGINGNIFLASDAGAGSHTISYLFTDNNNCTSTTSKNTNVTSLPSVNFNGLDTSYCINSSTSILTGIPSGGTFSGPGITGNVFSPASSGIGNHSINYSFTDVNNCSNSISKTVSVNSLPIVDFTGLDTSYCLNSSSSNLNGIPPGGIFTGPGITGNIFFPNNSGIGTHTISYSYTDIFGCSNSISKNVLIFDIPVVNFNGLDTSYCLNASNASLTGFPSGGTFSGAGMTGNIFSPEDAGVGAHSISYLYSNNNNCSVTHTKNIIVLALPVLNISGLNIAYCIDSSATLLTGSPSGGIFSGTGLTGNIFNPADAGAGTHSISYEYTDSNFCSNSISENTTVYLHPVVTFNGLDTSYCENHNPIVLSGFPSGGTFSGTGIIGDEFDPNTATPGTYQIIYTYILQSVCADLDTQYVIVREAPVTSFNGLNSEYCKDENPALLTGSPAGGLFSGDGITGNIFNPASTSSSNIIISYSFTNGYGCESHSLQNTTVYNLPLINFGGLNNSYCTNSNPSILVGMPSGGTFSGSGVSGSIFYPSNAPVGEDTIRYFYTDVHGCSAIDFQTTQVHGLPAVSMTGLDSNYCFNNSSSVLYGNPTGGSFSGGNISGNMFFPNIAGTGFHQIIYSYTDFNGCTNRDTALTTVYGLPNVTLEIADTVFCKNSQPETLTGNPTGGSFYGNGVDGNLFKPEIAGTGSAYIYYIFNDLNGCSNTDSSIVSVHDSPNFSFSTDTLKGTFPFIINAGSGYSTYLWETGSTEQMITVNSPEWYSVTVTNIWGCASSDSVYVLKLIGIDEIDSKTKISVYPNPAHLKTTITIEAENPADFYIELMNYCSEILFTKEISKSAFISETIDLTNISRGIYLLKIQKEGKFIIRKLIIY